MTSIKAPGGSMGPTGVGVPTAPDTGATGTASFRETTQALPKAPSNATQAVISDLSAGRITPNQAVDRLTALAVEKSRCPESARPAVEQQIRQLLANDPVVGSLLRQMGASLPTEP